LNRCAAVLAASADAISTKAKPRDRPVSRSVTTETDSTPSTWENSWRNVSVDVLKERPPTKSLCGTGLPPTGSALIHALWNSGTGHQSVA
jgi:hypothetical protein